MPDNEFNANLMLAKIGDTHYRRGNVSEASSTYAQMQVVKPDPSKLTGGVVKKPSVGGLLSGGGLRGAIPGGGGGGAAGAASTAMGAPEHPGAFGFIAEIITRPRMGVGRIDISITTWRLKKAFEEALRRLHADLRQFGNAACSHCRRTSLATSRFAKSAKVT